MILGELTCRNYKRMSNGFILTCLTCEPRWVNFISYINPFQSDNDTSFSNASYLLISVFAYVYIVICLCKYAD